MNWIGTEPNRLLPDEQAALNQFCKRVTVQFYIRLAAIEVAVAAVLIRTRSNDGVRIVAVVLGSALVAQAVHRARLRRLMRKAAASPENLAITFSALADLAVEEEARRLPMDRLTLLVLFISFTLAAFSLIL